MKRKEITELHYITPVVNVPSILQRGILSYRRAGTVLHESVAMPEVQALRASVRLPTGRMLHEHVNLYFDARNPMMYARKEHHQSLTVLQVSPTVLDLPGVMISDGNAARRFGTRFSAPDSAGLSLLDAAKVFAHDWNHPDPQIKDEHKRIRCAEVLVPDRVDPAYITGAYVSCDESRATLVAFGWELHIIESEHLFFRGLGRGR
jgi:hypothetical protein